MVRPESRTHVSDIHEAVLSNLNEHVCVRDDSVTSSAIRTELTLPCPGHAPGAW